MKVVASRMSRIRRHVAGEIALHSTKTGLFRARPSGPRMRSATSTATPGGTIERTKSAPRTSVSSSSTTSSPAPRTRATLSALRPATEVTTCAPASRSLRPTAAPISPAPTIATVTASRSFIGVPLAELCAEFSVAVEAREPIGVKVRVAEQLLAYANPLHEQPDVELVGHPDAAMHLHRFIHGERGAEAGASLRHRHDRTRAIVRIVERLQRLEHGRARNFEFAVE